MRKPITAESLRASRPHTHSASPLLTTIEGSTDKGGRLSETCHCGCERIVLITNDGRRLPGSWT